MFRDDLQAARRIILENHPGPVDALNPGFGKCLNAGFEQQMALVESIDTADAYLYALLKFVGGFRDGRLGIRFDVDRGPARWPGFFTTWRNGMVVIHTIDPALVPELAEGDRLQSCDGQNAEQLVRQRVFDFQFDPALPANWVPAAARAFVDLGNPFVGVPMQCVFVRQDREIVHDLEWREISWDERRDDYSAARGRTRPEIGLYVPEPDVYLFAEALWDESPDNVEKDLEFVEWRVSEGNIAYWETVPSIIRTQFGDSHSAVGWSQHVRRNLEASLKDSRDFWRETPVDGDQKPEDASTAKKSNPVTPKYRGTVAVLTDTTCGSACLDAMSLLTEIPEVVHVGSLTAADTQYMEARPAPLPSGLATLGIPIKVYRGRVRPDGGYFTPAFQYEGLHWTDEALRAWVLSLWREGELEANEH